MSAVAPVLTPQGVLILRRSDDQASTDLARAARLEARFSRGTGHGLLSLGADEVGTALPPVLIAFVLQKSLVAGMTAGGVKG